MGEFTIAQTEPFKGKTGNWFTNLLGCAAKGGLKIGVDAASQIATSAITYHNRSSAAGTDGGDPALGCSGRYGNQGTGTKNRPPTVLSALFSLLNATSRNAISSWPATVCRQNQVSTWRLDGAAPAA